MSDSRVTPQLGQSIQGQWPLRPLSTKLVVRRTQSVKSEILTYKNIYFEDFYCGVGKPGKWQVLLRVWSTSNLLLYSLHEKHYQLHH